MCACKRGKETNKKLRKTGEKEIYYPVKYDQYLKNVIKVFIKSGNVLFISDNISILSILFQILPM